MDFDEFQPERFGLGEYTVQRSLVGQHARQHGIVAVRPGPEAGERAADRLAQATANTDLVPLGLSITMCSTCHVRTAPAKSRPPAGAT